MNSKFLIASGIATLAPLVASAQLKEPDTVFYGRVLHHGGGEPHLITSGDLAWKIVPPHGDPITTKAALTSYDGGNYSYSIRIPRHLAMTGLPEYSVPAGLPVLADITQRYRNAEITVNGKTAKLADPAALSFPADGSNRADFVRADLIVDFPLPDADGDGLPDWWEDQYGLATFVSSANADSDHDGITDLAEYIAGTNPSQAGTAPRLAGDLRVTIPKNGRAALLAKAQDSDTPTALLRYTLNALSANVSVTVLDGAADGRSDRKVLAGGNFNQAEIDAGQVIFSATGTLEDATAEISLVDEVPGRTPVTASIQISTVIPADLYAAANLRESVVSAALTLHDASSSPVLRTLRAPSGPVDSTNPMARATYLTTWVPRHGPDEARLFLGSAHDDILLGSGENDVLSAGAGTNRLLGFAGADRFVFTIPAARDTLGDFSASDRDVLDVSALLTPTGDKPLAAYLSLQNGMLKVDANGDGSGFTDATITLTNPEMPADLDEAWDAGLIDAGTVVSRTTLFVTATAAAEEGLVPGKISIRRRGDASRILTVPLQISGTATAGSDYVSLPANITFAIGQKVVVLDVVPLADDSREPVETIEIALSSAAGYDLGKGTASVSITDMPARVWLEVVERSAFKDSLSPAQVVLRRSGPLSAALTAFIQTSGRATPAVDYRRPSSSFTFAAWQDVISIDIIPLSSATLTNGCEDVILSLKSDINYLFGATQKAGLVICDRPQTLADWRAAKLPGNLMDDEQFLDSDSDGDGFSGLMEYALNLDPKTHDRGDKTLTKLIFDANGIPGFEFRRRPGAPEILSEVCQSTDLKHWQPFVAEDSEERSAVMESDGLERVQQFMKHKPASGPVFFSLRIKLR